MAAWRFRAPTPQLVSVVPPQGLLAPQPRVLGLAASLGGPREGSLSSPIVLRMGLGASGVAPEKMLPGLVGVRPPILPVSDSLVLSRRPGQWEVRSYTWKEAGEGGEGITRKIGVSAQAPGP